MSVTMSRTDGVTMFTLTSDPDSRWPPLCQILKSLCYSPVCCSVSQQLRTVLKTSLSVLAAVHMMIGLLNIGLGVIYHLSYSAPYFYYFTCFPYWMGSLFIVFGIMCILSEKYPSPCLIILNVFVNLAGAALAIAAIVLYSVVEGNMYVWFSCDDGQYYYYRRTTPSPSADAAYFKEKCLEGKAMIQMLLRSILGVLIVLSVVELCVAISSAVLGIKALRRTGKQNKASDESEYFKPLLEEVTTEPAV
ncbi:transmembrane protein 176B-like [Xiphophorus hellerii]|uniref:transmembrane protein 176B-like n=1 Tax=Xiphophorus hellerii TaxID=8084 RepID=UPI0013B3C0F7|nr:transmembrane protein 176B-like [Xiphophorus hellerii]XP_032415202.1 transmembrane protein 176B-like [Xiphophorus hellerii]XP_032415203.1 transmembrane protein 176B-like [Xiphophorus hellerii]